MQKAKLADSVYPVRGIANRSIIDPEYLPPESLSRNTAVLEQAIAGGKLLELNRFSGVGKFEGEETGFFLAFPLQIVFHKKGKKPPPGQLRLFWDEVDMGNEEIIGVATKFVKANCYSPNPKSF